MSYTRLLQEMGYDIMDKKVIITIGRQFGSGGREIGQKLSEKLGISFYDKELLAMASKESGLCEEIFQLHDEKPTNSFLYSLVMDTYSMSYASQHYVDMPINQKVFLAQFDSIKKLAEKEACVIVGRCADYALEDRDDMVSIFIHSDMDTRIKRISESYNLKNNAAKDLIIKTDKKRANYYNYYTNKKWGDSRSYHMCINSNVLGIDKTVDVIIDYIQEKFK